MILAFPCFLVLGVEKSFGVLSPIFTFYWRSGKILLFRFYLSDVLEFPFAIIVSLFVLVTVVFLIRFCSVFHFAFFILEKTNKTIKIKAGALSYSEMLLKAQIVLLLV